MIIEGLFLLWVFASGFTIIAFTLEKIIQLLKKGKQKYFPFFCPKLSEYSEDSEYSTRFFRHFQSFPIQNFQNFQNFQNIRHSQTFPFQNIQTILNFHFFPANKFQPLPFFDRPGELSNCFRHFQFIPCHFQGLPLEIKPIQYLPKCGVSCKNQNFLIFSFFFFYKNFQFWS